MKTLYRLHVGLTYNKENEVSCDVLVPGGGIAGCWAAIGAPRKGARVVTVEKGAKETSGTGGSGVDHLHAAVTNPGSKITPEEFSKAVIEENRGWRCGISHYITSKETTTMRRWRTWAATSFALPFPRRE